MSDTWRPLAFGYDPQNAPDGPEYELDPSNFVVSGEDGLLLCLACDDDDHHTCYGERCECWCEGEEAGF